MEAELYSTLSASCSAEQKRRSAIEAQMPYASSAGKDKLRQRLDAAKVPSCEAFSRYFEGGN